METEDRDSEEAEKPNIITFDPSLPTSHAVSDSAPSFLFYYPNTPCLHLPFTLFYSVV